MTTKWPSWGPLPRSSLTRALCALDDASPAAAVRLVEELPLSERSTLTLTTGPSRFDQGFPTECIDQTTAGAIAATGRSHLVEALVARLPPPENSCATNEAADALLAAVLHRDAATLDRLFDGPHPPVDGMNREGGVRHLPGKLPRSVWAHHHEEVAGTARETDFFVRCYNRVRDCRADPERVLMAAVETGASGAVRRIVEENPHVLVRKPASEWFVVALESQPEGRAMQTGQVELVGFLKEFHRTRCAPQEHAKWSMGLLRLWSSQAPSKGASAWAPLPGEDVSALATSLLQSVEDDARPEAVLCAVRHHPCLGSDFFDAVAALRLPLLPGEWAVWALSDEATTEKALRRIHQAPSFDADVSSTGAHARELEGVLGQESSPNWAVVWAWCDSGALGSEWSEDRVLDLVRSVRGEATAARAHSARMTATLPSGRPPVRPRF